MLAEGAACGRRGWDEVIFGCKIQRGSRRWCGYRIRVRSKEDSPASGLEAGA
jgi:hypothetical protein